MHIVHCVHDYAAPASEVFRVATDWDCFRRAMARVATFHRLPGEPMHQGQVIKTSVRLFGWLPPMPHTIEIKVFDAKALRVESHEYGGRIKQWDHTIQVTGDADHSRLADTLVIDAGAMTRLYALWARYALRQRHIPRLEILGLT